jgi:hypothetical protein
MIATGRVVALLLVVAAMASPSLAFAEDTFQTEAGLSYSRFNSDLARQNTVGAEVTYFFDKLPTLPKDYPLDQTQFVERIGSVSANYGRSSFDIDDTQSLSKGSMYGVSLLFMRPGSPLVVGAGYDSFYSGKSRSQFSFFENESDTRSYQLAIGAYVDKTTALTLDWSRSRTRTKFTSSGLTFFEFNDTFTSVGFSGKHLARLSGGDHVAIVAGVSQLTHEQEGAASEKNRDLFIQATYYPMKTLGLTLGVSSDRGDDRLSEGETYLAGVKMFVTTTISLSLDYQRFQAKAPANRDDFFMLKGLVRF